MYHGKMKILIYYIDKHHMQMLLKYTPKQYSNNAGIWTISKVIQCLAKLQDTYLHTGIAVFAHNGSIDETMQIPIQGNFDFHDRDRPVIQGLYDTGTVINIEAPVFIDSFQITQNCLKEHEYNRILLSLNEKQQEFYKHILHAAMTIQ